MRLTEREVMLTNVRNQQIGHASTTGNVLDTLKLTLGSRNNLEKSKAWRSRADRVMCLPFSPTAW